MTCRHTWPQDAQRPSSRRFPTALAVLLLPLLACGDSPTDAGPSEGTIVLEIVTTGTDFSAFYTLSANGSQAAVEPNQTVTFDNIVPGTYVFELTGADYNCRLSGASQVAATVRAGETTTVTFQMACSPKEIAFISSVDGSFDLYRRGVNETTALRMLPRPTSKEDESAWSPDGTRLAFASDMGGDFDIYTVDADGSNLRNLTQNPSAIEGMPSWSPDGASIAYRSLANGNEDIWVMGSDGSNRRGLITTPAREFLPQWSPDGRKIAFVSDDDGNNDIWVLEVATQSYSKLTSDSAADEWPSWSPNGAKIAFASNRDGNGEIYVMNADGSGQYNLSATPGSNEWLPSWSPDGRYLTFTTDRAGNLDIYWMRSNGTEVSPVATSSAHEFFATWRAPTN